MLVIDFETRSRVDIKQAGTYRYVTSRTTEIICLAIIDDATDREFSWTPGESPDHLHELFKQADEIYAHNVEFDQGIYEFILTSDFGFPELRPDVWHCSSATARTAGLPGSLEGAARAAGLTKRKYSRGTHLIRKLSVPQADGTFNLDPALLAEMAVYCMEDVRLTRDLLYAIPAMSTVEEADLLITIRMNERGLKVDRELATLAMTYADAERSEIGAKLSEITDGAVTKHTQALRIKKWLLLDRIAQPIIEPFMTVYKAGVKKISLEKNIRGELLALGDQLPRHTLEVIELVDAGNKSSVAKFDKMLHAASPEDDRIRGAFIYYGAGQTGRYSARLFQAHNMIRDCFKPEEVERLKRIMRVGGPLLDTQGDGLPVMHTLSKLLRPAIIAEKGCSLVIGDWSSIEARIAPWLADTFGGKNKLAAFARGDDIYIETALAMGLTEDDRQIGKVCELAFTYQGAVGAYANMAKNYGVYTPEAQVKSLVERWRRVNLWAVRYWELLERAAVMALKNPGISCIAGLLSYQYHPDVVGGSLICTMPGGYEIRYPHSRLELIDTPWGVKKRAVTALKASVKPKADAKSWPRTALYGGKQLENACQAMSAALLREKKRGLNNLIASIHDELVMEVYDEDSPSATKYLKTHMERSTKWTTGLPLEAKVSTAKRYGK